MATGIRQRRIERLIDSCHADLELPGLSAEVLRRLPGILPLEAAFFATVDPATLLFTSVVAQEPLAGVGPLFLDNEFGREDVNKFAALARGPDAVMSLDRATLGRRSASARYREIMAGLGLGDELRAALIAGRDCWGVLCLHRADADAGFSDQDLAAVRTLAPHLAEGLRRGMVREAVTRDGPGAPGAPGVIVLDRELALVSISPDAERWLDRLPPPKVRGLPWPVYSVAARLTRSPDVRGADVRGADVRGADAPDRRGPVRLRTVDGHWLALHATRLRGSADDQVCVVVEPAPAAAIGSLLLAAHGLTPAQNRVAALVLQGCSTREIVGRLHVSAYTVQEHLTAVFARFGVASRRELIAAVLSSAER
ncbi:LuxR C-terminal-related transcriptional regulator [Streptomyces sp. SP17BM10]|uniref:helix-turn-helix transcriptional regulator n=1 Tax=Streptomyces sp. SP17BM10 TaxID=3002530 RepID=UPI002E7A27FC|nr:LuxR C-terminal-related transcriptional regulator [Streptomyces sp. SP17BM10]MEE1782166.1 LuxR C-terminal-related transcriptional regulator [Streptomyces sp. SP17BM10]